MEVCGTCGLIAPSKRGTCDACEAPFATPRMQVPPLGDDLYWVSVRCEHRCRACGLTTPLNELDADGIVACERCGIDQAMDVSEWARIFQHAHEVGDLAGPDPNGRKPAKDADIADQNHFKTTGVKHGAAPSQDYGEGHARVTAGPGHPLCKQCKVPLVVPFDARAFKECRATASCPTCKASATYALPKNAREAYPALRAVIAEGNRDGVKHAVVAGSAGQPVILRCPGCGADLPAFDPATRQVTCTFCKVVAFVPARASARQGAAALPAEAWWLLFRGPSPRRTALEDSVRQHDRKAARQRAHDQQTSERRETKKQERAREDAAKVARAAALEQIEAEEEAEQQLTSRREDARTKIAFVVGIPLLFIGIVLAVVYGQR
jgi:hypothetical protein